MEENPATGAVSLCMLPALTGAALALHFTILEARGLDELTCPRYARTVCVVLRKTRWYRILFGVPNPIWALLYFVIAVGALATAPHPAAMAPAVRTFAGLGALYALLLQSILVFHLRVWCAVCLTFTALALLTALCFFR
jgi:hypothetical protein